MAARGDVLSLRRPVGFLRGERLERYVVLQSTALSTVLDTLVVAPLDRALPAYGALPGLVRISAAEAGTDGDQIAIIPHLQGLPLDRFEAVRAGRLRPATLRRVESVLRVLFELE